jgi:predicted PurR-regulated permease PerM
MAVFGLYAVVNFVIGGWLEPKFVGDRIGLSPLVVLVSLVFWGWVWGTMGLLLAVPMTVAFKTVLENTVELRAFAILLGSSKDLDRVYDDDGEVPSHPSIAA